MREMLGTANWSRAARRTRLSRLPMKSWSLMLFLAAAALPACAQEGAGARSFQAGAGGSGGSDDGAGGHGGASATASAGGGASGATTGALVGCDETASCGDLGTGCVHCAIGSSCADEYATCKESPDCVDFGACSGQCDAADTACDQACVDQYPDGAKQYAALVLCAICVECPTSCADLASICPK